MKLLFATTNQGKLKEAQQILSRFNLELLSVNNFKKLQSVVVDETGDTLKKNALLKAKTFGDLVGVLTLAEDSGLMVDALDGRPGIHSARFGSSVNERNQRLLKEMEGKKERNARFISVFCLYNPQTQEAQYAKGVVEGSIATEPKGELGFGYDPVFIPEGSKKTFGESGEELKNRISHRRQAIEKLKTLMLS